MPTSVISVEAEAKLNYKSLKVEPIVEGNWLYFEVTNVGNVDLELLMFEILLPDVAKYVRG